MKRMRLLMFVVLAGLLTPLGVWARPVTPPQVQPQAPNAPSFFIDPSIVDQDAVAGQTLQLIFTVRNSSTAPDNTTQETYTYLQPNTPGGWTITFNPANSPLPGITSGESTSFVANIQIPATARGLFTFNIQARATVSNIIRSADIRLNVVAPTATPTRTNTPTPSTPTATTTGTPGRVCNGSGGTLNDKFEPDNTRSQARRIEVDVPQIHAICPVGDEDWLLFGGLEGKVYTIDVSQMTDGLDLSLTLYDSNGNQLAFNDDFPRNNDPSDIKPRIQSWRAPANGQYYIKVRDSAGRGFVDALYTVVLNSESYGPTPTLIPEICEDLYEPDGLPEIAPLIVVGEVHPNHRLCPRGDADWVKFFGKSGKIYSLFTSDLSVGADTVMVLADRDGTTIIDFNDDYESGLDSRIDFAPVVDGFYFVQVKNVGDVGNQFIDYTLTFQIKSNANQGQPTMQPTATFDDGEITPTLDEDDLTPTFDDERTPTTTGTVTGTPTRTPTSAYPTPTNFSGNKLPNFDTRSNGKFADPAFNKVWTHADSPVASGQAVRSWLWGPNSGQARAEVYDQSPGGLRQVQYFDKSRMEISDFESDRQSQWFVTNGLLAKELIQGQIQIGDSNYVQRTPAQINIAGDLGDASAPTYASFSNLLGATSNRTGQFADQQLARSGKVSAYAGNLNDAAKLVHYVPETGHNIPNAFWNFVNRQGLVNQNGKVQEGQVMDWVFALGYPISEAYWAKVYVGGVEQTVLVQAFERRVLTYTPSNPADWQVEMGNVGQHYEQWRYR
ncbi:pre-peptidase C-terminal domain-containing protein [Herpetosiphon giganteus]|uniref:pre-peptidase C-terminal domain-containing protein n=1 Tax=Herpetosiphon giganteus TaxID=2029754 RepID=UPI001959648D|nr:pre-peptidase C-terminal domain-containing protein [Herpetosiphon giganteus]MBM7844059.1 hypothetical protein [Herpetosiphon giganteus]